MMRKYFINQKKTKNIIKKLHIPVWAAKQMKVSAEQEDLTGRQGIVYKSALPPANLTYFWAKAPKKLFAGLISDKT